MNNVRYFRFYKCVAGFPDSSREALEARWESSST